MLYFLMSIIVIIFTVILLALVTILVLPSIFFKKIKKAFEAKNTSTQDYKIEPAKKYPDSYYTDYQIINKDGETQQ